MTIAALPSSISSVQPPTGFVLLDAVLAAADATIGAGLDAPLRAISWAVAGDIKVDTPYADGLTIPSGALAATIQHGCVIKKVWKIGTTATGLIGWY